MKQITQMKKSRALAETLLAIIQYGHKVEIYPLLDRKIKIEAYHSELENGLVTFKPSVSGFKKAANRLLSQIRVEK